jgi:predicted metalloprotease with PDZ domain
VDASRVNEHVFTVRLRVPKPDAETVLRLPVWIPGSYLVREFARHVLRVSARQGRRPVPISPLDKASWQVACTGQGDLVLDWDIYAFDTSVRAAFLSPQRGFFNGTSVFPAVVGREALPQRVTLLPVPDASWRVTTSLPATRRGTDPQGFGDYVAASYDELIDHPVEMGTQQVGRFEAGGVPHVLAISGAGPRFDETRLLADTQRICEAAIRLWHPGRRDRPPFSHYAFLLNVVDDGYGGLEHRASTALIAARRDLPKLGDKPASGNALGEGYTTLLGLISHEYFHTWQVKRLKPREFVPYDLTRENHTELLWFFEGFTSYYDDLLLARAGLVDAARYAKLLSKTVQNVAATPGRKLSSAAQASMDAWLKYYRPDENTPNATVSYYAKGALVALCLDLTLRSEGHTTLDEVMRALWARCVPVNDTDRPMSEDDLRAVLRELGGRSFDAELDAWVHGTAELPLEPLLKRFGLLMRHDPPTLAQRLGVRAADAPGGIQIKAVLSGGPAQAAGLAPGDELLAITPLPQAGRGTKAKRAAAGTWRLRKLDDWALYSPVDDAVSEVAALVVRDQQVLTLKLRLPATLGTPNLTLDPQASADALARQTQWLGSSLQQGKHLGAKRL